MDGDGGTNEFPIVPRDLRNFPEYDVINGRVGREVYSRIFNTSPGIEKKRRLRKDLKHVKMIPGYETMFLYLK